MQLLARACLTAAATAALMIPSALPALAAPIDCPNGQTATKVSGGWACVNNGGNQSNAQDPKNPNAGKNFFSP
jgi:hypothetical protein